LHVVDREHKMAYSMKTVNMRAGYVIEASVRMGLSTVSSPAVIFQAKRNGC